MVEKISIILKHFTFCLDQKKNILGYIVASNQIHFVNDQRYFILRCGALVFYVKNICGYNNNTLFFSAGK